jgi:hypothetical protein
MITPTHVTVTEMRRQDLLADADRARRVSAARSTNSSRPTPRPLTRARAYARYAVSCLASVAFGLQSN